MTLTPSKSRTLTLPTDNTVIDRATYTIKATRSGRILVTGASGGPVSLRVGESATFRPFRGVYQLIDRPPVRRVHRQEKRRIRAAIRRGVR
jgi:hypothetical protein